MSDKNIIKEAIASIIRGQFPQMAEAEVQELVVIVFAQLISTGVVGVAGVMGNTTYIALLIQKAIEYRRLHGDSSTDAPPPKDK